MNEEDVKLKYGWWMEYDDNNIAKLGKFHIAKVKNNQYIR